MSVAREGIVRKSAGLGPGGRPKSGITEGFVDGCWVLGGAGGADRLQAELRAASRYGTGAAPQPSRASSPACEDLGQGQRWRGTKGNVG